MIGFIYAMTDDPNDREFIVWLYETYQRLMYATAWKVVTDPESCKDIVQDSLEKLIHKAGFLRKQDSRIYVSYIVSTVRNTAINYLRQQTSSSKQCIRLDEDVEIDSPEPSLDEMVILAEQKELLVEVLHQLSSEDRLLLEGRYLLDYTNAELADMLHCKPSSIRMMLTRARRHALQKMFKEVGEKHDTTGSTAGRV